MSTRCQSLRLVISDTPPRPPGGHLVVLAVRAPVIRVPAVLAPVALGLVVPAQAVVVKVLQALGLVVPAQAVVVKVLWVLVLVPALETVAVHPVAVRAREVMIRTRSRLVLGARTHVRWVGDEV
ncbi:hypothetical protein QBC45DRAFT_216696 [Copromyces sp. CBS 386.78]|nr:hypothetical protein QBC45DRAFT_216696 [Copromyces sp. CBS 386.78]